MKVRTYALAPEKEHPTIGYEQPTSYSRGIGGKSGCLCLGARNYYSLKCCKGYLMNQGVGLVYTTQNLPSQPTLEQ